MYFYVTDYLKEGLSDSQCIKDCLLKVKNIKAHKKVVFSGRDWLIDEAILIYDDMEIIVDGCCIK